MLVTVIQPRDPWRRRAAPRAGPGLRPARSQGPQADGRHRHPGQDRLQGPGRGADRGAWPEASARRAHVTLAAVDEGILRLTKQDSPDPVGWYFGKRALTLDYRDDYGRLLDPNLGAPASVNFGGDELGGEGLTITPIKTVALWSGEVDTGLDGRATVKLPAADFNGQLRHHGGGLDRQPVGSGAKELTVRQPVVADLNLPRFLSPGDQAARRSSCRTWRARPGLYVRDLAGASVLVAVFQKAFQLILGQRIADTSPSPRRGHTGHRLDRLHGRRARLHHLEGLSDPDPAGLGPDHPLRLTELQRPGEAYTPPNELVRPRRRRQRHLPLGLIRLGHSAMEVATFNINNINRRLPNLLRWLRRPSPTSSACRN